MSAEKEKLRIDKYLWAIRLFKTRSIAADACESGKVKTGGVNVKPAKSVSVGDVYEVKTESRKWVIKVTGLLHNRVQYSEAVQFYADETPEEDKTIIKYQPSAFETGKRLSKIGRPTKKERRDLGGYLEE